MKGSDFSKVLQTLSEFAADAAARGATLELSALFASTGAATVAQTSKRLKSMSVGDVADTAPRWSKVALARFLDQAYQLFKAAGGSKAAEDFKSVADALRAGGNGDVTAWLGSARAFLLEPPKRGKRAPPKAKVSANPHALIEDYTARFSSAGLDLAAFDQVIESLKKDRRATVAVVKAVAERFSHVGGVSETKPKLVKAMRDEFVSRLRTRNELDVVAKTKPW